MNTYKIGDFVRLVEEDAEGYVTSILNDGMIAVTGQDGFEIPVMSSKVTFVHGKMDTEEDRAEQKQEIPQAEFVAEGVYLAIAGDSKQGVAEFYLVNETSYKILLAMNSLKSGKVKGEYAGEIPSKSAVRIYTANVVSVGTWPEFNFQLLYFSNNLRDSRKPLVIDRKIRPADLSTQKKENVTLGLKSWLFRLDEKEGQLDTSKLEEQFMSHRPKKK